MSIDREIFQGDDQDWAHKQSLRTSEPVKFSTAKVPTHGLDIDLDKAHDRIVVSNHARDPSYAPYCMRCSGLVRMTVVRPFYWKHYVCGAIHDETQVINGQSQTQKAEG